MVSPLAFLICPSFYDLCFLLLLMSNPILGREYEDQEVLVIDLYKRIYDQQTNIDKGFLVIFAGKNSLYGITIATLPNVEDVPVSIIQPVSSEYRDRDTLGIASHMMQVSIKKSEPQTVFLLDSELLLNMAS